MSRFIFPFFFSCVNLIYGQNQWQPQENAPNFIGDFSKLDDVYFHDEELGWTLNSFGDVFRTEDGGETWNQLDNLGVFLRCLKFANDSVGYTGSLEGTFGGPPSVAKIFKTVDGGNNWTDLTANITPAPSGFCGLSVVDENAVFACGAFYSPARVYKSLDGGITWENIDMSPHAVALVDLHFSDVNNGFVVGASNAGGGVILKTEDGGDTWDAVYETMVFTDLLWKIQKLDEDNYYASVAGVSATDGARILVSNDGGNSWESKLVFEELTQLQGVGFIDSMHGFAGGFFDGIYETTDGGDSWELIDIGANYNRFQKINDSLMVASGHTIYSYTRDISLSTLPEGKAKPPHPFKVYPNPAADHLTVEFEVPDNTFLEISLHDENGREVLGFYRGWSTAGIHKLTRDMTKLSNGIYTIRLASREGDVIERVVVAY
ncbi:MAG: YCF48-related protein [Bacteroidota bacterium]